jgi:5-methylthioadenosine/S-adenosylhomocysteine deaminase
MPSAAVLEMATMGGARAVGRAEDIGSIEVGKSADLAVVRVDRSHVAPLAGSLPADQIVYACQTSDVSFVLVAGSVVVCDGRLCTGDEAAIVSEAETQRVALLARAGIG